MNPLLNIATTAARKAGNLMIRSWQRLDTVRVTAKGLKDFVTEIDKKAEEAIIGVIREAYPSHQIIAEESGDHKGQADCTWIIDPLDGTHNYFRGIPHFCVSIAFQSKGKIEHGLIYDPIRHELFTASRGKGARLNNQRLRVSGTTKLENALIATGFPMRYPERLPQSQEIWQHLLPQVADIRCLGSAALDLAYVAAGRLDGYVECCLKPWDISAGILLVTEAGGLTADWQGREADANTSDIVAGTPKIFVSLLQQIGKKAR